MSYRDKVQKDALDAISKKNRCGIAVSMGVGKTRIALKDLISNDDINKVLVVVPRKSIIKSWEDEIDKMNVSYIRDYIDYTTYLSINKYDPSNYDKVYLDECHNILPTHTEFLANFRGGILGLTGTPPKRKTSDKYKLVNKYCPIVFNFTVDEASEGGILNNYKIIVHVLELSKSNYIPILNSDLEYFYTSEVENYKYLTEVFDNAESENDKKFSALNRMRALQTYRTKELYAKKLIANTSEKCIIFANTKSQARDLSEYCYFSGNLNSEENMEKFSEGKIKTLSCIDQISEGVTVPNLKEGVIIHSYSNERKSAQRIGRLLRLNPDDEATCHILTYKDTVDIKWTMKALEDFDSKNIIMYNPYTQNSVNMGI